MTAHRALVLADGAPPTRAGLDAAWPGWADGIDLVVFEEFGSGRAALHLKEEVARNELLRDEAYRRWFRQDFDKKFSPRVWHRDFDDTTSGAGRLLADQHSARSAVCKPEHVRLPP